MTIIVTERFTSYKKGNDGILYSKDEKGQDWYDLMLTIPEGYTTFHILPSQEEGNYISQVATDPSHLFPFDGWIVSFNNKTKNLFEDNKITDLEYIASLSWDFNKNIFVENLSFINLIVEKNKKMKTKLLLELFSEKELLEQLLEDEPENKELKEKLEQVKNLRKKLYKLNLDNTKKEIDWSEYYPTYRG